MTHRDKDIIIKHPIVDSGYMDLHIKDKHLDDVAALFESDYAENAIKAISEHVSGKTSRFVLFARINEIINVAFAFAEDSHDDFHAGEEL